MSELYPGFAHEQRRVNGITLNVRHGGRGPPLLLVHGFPQTHAIWHAVAPILKQHYTLVMPDLRGYGDSDKPPTDALHAPYSKREMARDLVGLMGGFGHDRFQVCGHDRGGRVAHRLALDHPPAVSRLMVLDISPTLTMYEQTSMGFARDYYHWFFLIQPAPFPEHMIGGDPLFYLRAKLGAWGATSHAVFDPRALAEYERCFTPEAIHAMCEDYRAAASIDLEHDRANGAARVACPLHVLWGERGAVQRHFAPLSDWRKKVAAPVSGRALPCGHYIAEEVPETLLPEMIEFFGHGTA